MTTTPAPATRPTIRIDRHNVASYLAQHGLIDADAPLSVEILAGGVSSDVLAVTAAGKQLVVKQALPELKVAEDWKSNPDRILTEAHALNIAGHIRPGAVPALRSLDASNHIVVMDRISDRFTPWKTELLKGHINPAIADRLGADLAAWHSATLNRSALGTNFDDLDTFIELRVDPFYRTVTERNPILTEQISDLVRQLLDTRQCLVHGDFSPKNVLVDDDEAVVLDWEVAHFGDPVFDLAFLLSHLLCKSAHDQAHAPQFRECAQLFIRSYRTSTASELAHLDESYLAGHTAALALARVDGKSPANYLSGAARKRIKTLSIAALSTSAPRTPSTLWELL
ncbi:phosphotransferase [Rhodococcus sp. NPDC059968]|uniref:phosphotransferase n=1 Tax=Rhodococcus sp. NPDC059968 TaxID=3347017 RepID=UPI00366D05E6